MTVQDMISELDLIELENARYKAIIENPHTSKEKKAECRERMLENNHERMHLESVLVTLKVDPLF